MPAVKLQKFLGAAPRVAPELLPEGAGQIAHGVKLYSGDLLPYPLPVLHGTTGRDSETGTLYALRNPDTDALVWLAWDEDVDIVVASESEDSDQRFYYTGAGSPKVTTYSKAVVGSAPYPAGYYELGLPLPTATPTAVATSFSVVSSVSYARDSGNTATLVTGTHGLRTGNIITIREFGTGTPATFNAVNVRVTVLSPTSISYYSSGAAVGTTANTDGRIDLAGNTVARQYTYTWYTPWDEESIGSEPSTAIFVKEGQTVTVDDLPEEPPAGDYFIRGIRLYRTLTSAAGTEFYRLSTLWFPTATATVARTSNVATVTLAYPHNLIVGDRFKISGCTDNTFDETDGIVTVVPDELSFSYASTGDDEVATADATGTLYHDCAELADDAARYWGDGDDFTFTDDFTATNLTEILLTDDFDAPDPSMIGIISAQNDMLVGFFGNQLCFSEPTRPHAWPIIYRRTFEDTIVAIAPVGGYIIVLTEKYAYRVNGSNPTSLNIGRIDKPYPCLSKRSVVSMPYGVLYATNGGLALWAQGTGLTLATNLLHHWDTWDTAVDPTTIKAVLHKDRYLASHSTGGFTFERDDKVGGYFITLNYAATATWVDPSTDMLYYARGSDGDIYRWDDITQPSSTAEWKSKVIVTQDYINLGAARVIADYGMTAAELTALETYNAAALVSNALLWTLTDQLGTLNGPADYTQSATRRTPKGGLNSLPLNGSYMTDQLAIPDGAVTFKLWANGVLMCTYQRASSAIFRLPTGYKTDTYEVSVSGAVRIKAIHLGETPYGLRKA